MAEPSSAEAILFFEDHHVVKQMTYAEFQAILDNYVPMQDIASKMMHAVYLRIDSELHVTAAVFFIIPFDNQGFVEREWNIPLQHMADNAAKGPNLGAGQINLACYSQCPIEWHKNELWDPAMQASSNDFLAIKKTIKDNALGIVFRKKDEFSQAEDDNRFDEERTRAAMLIKEQRLRHKLLTTKAEQDKRQLSLDHQERLISYQQQINEYQQELNEQRAANLELKEEVTTQANKIAGMREYFESKLANAQNAEDSELQALKEHFDEELQTQVDAAVDEYRSALKEKDVQLLYRSEREEKLQEQILALQKENQRLLSTSGEAIFAQLEEAGVDFVIYHPGAGHMNIPSMDISSYLENPTAYVAKKCGVNEHLYRTWLDHFYSPTCQHEMENGEPCGKALIRVDDPSKFILGESDRCAEHNTRTTSVVSISKNSAQPEIRYSTKNS